MRRPKRPLVDIDSLLDGDRGLRPTPNPPIHRHTEIVVTNTGISTSRSYHTAQPEPAMSNDLSAADSNEMETDASSLHIIEPEEPTEDGTVIRLISRNRTIGVCPIIYQRSTMETDVRYYRTTPCLSGYLKLTRLSRSSFDWRDAVISTLPL